ncbi:MAG: tyrosine-type recombinase/integrase [Campylobacterota bacterium]|nr:tyrosine-type recombinase/integrase [Campylobacterota bacterium]
MKFRKRVPKVLAGYFTKKEFLKTVTASEARRLEVKIEEAVAVAVSNLPDKAKEQLIIEGLSIFKPITIVVRVNDAVQMYLNDSSHVTALEYYNRIYFFTQLFPALLKHVTGSENPEVSNITTVQLNKITSILGKMPSRNFKKYRSIELGKLISGIAKGVITPDDNERMSIETANKMIKRIRSLALYGAKTGQFNMTSTIQTLKKSKTARSEREALTVEEIETLLQHAPDERIVALIQTVRYTGLRSSELGKAVISDVFDLTQATSLKTASSSRIIPVHSKLKEHIPALQILLKNYTVKYASRIVKNLINEHLVNPRNKTLYSLRHSFATELLRRDADANIVSELMGHAHKTMTLSRYSKGYSINQLRAVIELL